MRRRGCKQYCHNINNTHAKRIFSELILTACFALHLTWIAPGKSSFKLVTDYNMPGLSGLEVARAVRDIRPGLAVAVASGFMDEALRTQAAAAGVRELIVKADDVEVFCNVVQRLVGQSSDAA